MTSMPIDKIEIATVVPLWQWEPLSLFGIGVVTIIVGYLLTAIAGPPLIDPRMSEEQIAETIQKQDEGHWTRYVVLSGYCLVAISVVWRIVRWLV